MGYVMAGPMPKRNDRAPMPRRAPVAMPRRNEQQAVPADPNAVTHAPAFMNASPPPGARPVGGRMSAQSHPYSKDVVTMQTNMIGLMDLINKELPQLSSASDHKAHKDNGMAEKLNIDPNLINKIKSISTKKLGPEMGGSMVGDGLWGQKTQDALTAIYSYMRAINDLKLSAPGYTQLDNLNIEDSLQKFKEIVSKKVNEIPNVSEYAKSATQILKEVSNYTGVVSKIIKDNPAAIDSVHKKIQEQVTPEQDVEQKQESQPGQAQSKNPYQVVQYIAGVKPQELEEVRKYSPFSPGLINIEMMSRFITSIQSLLADKEIEEILEANTEAIIGSSGTFRNAYDKWVGIAHTGLGGVGMKQITFDLGQPNLAQNFIQSFAKPSEAIAAASILKEMIDACVDTLVALNSNQATVMILGGKGMLQKQINLGQSYSNKLIAVRNQAMIQPSVH